MPTENERINIPDSNVALENINPNSEQKLIQE